MANKNNRDKSTAYHNLLHWKITLPATTFLLLRTPCFFLLSLHLLLLLCSRSPSQAHVSIMSTLLRYLSIPSGSWSSFHLPSFPPLCMFAHLSSSPPTRQVSFNPPLVPLFRAAVDKRQHCLDLIALYFTARMCSSLLVC